MVEYKQPNETILRLTEEILAQNRLILESNLRLLSSLQTAPVVHADISLSPEQRRAFGLKSKISEDK